MLLRSWSRLVRNMKTRIVIGSNTSSQCHCSCLFRHKRIWAFGDWQSQYQRFTTTMSNLQHATYVDRKHAGGWAATSSKQVNA